MDNNEIDAIIARAMQEYVGVNPQANSTAPSIEQEPVAYPEAGDPYIPETANAVDEANEVIDNMMDIAESSSNEELDEDDNVEGGIPRNPGSLEVDDSDSRFRGAEWFEDFKKLDITIAGVGGIGSYVAFLVSRLKPNSISIYDNDTIEEANLSGQLFARRDIGRSKVAAVGDVIFDFSGYSSVFENHTMFGANSPMFPILVCGFDNMASREAAFLKWETRVNRATEKDRKKYLFIDGRLAAEDFQVFCITGDNQWAINEYKKNYLFTDSEADEVICSYKQTSYVANMIGTVITNLLVNFAYNTEDRPIVRSLPFITEYSATTMLLKVTN